MTALHDLMAFQRETEALSLVAERLGWDQETMMPKGAADQRAEEIAALEGVLHARRTDPRIADWLAALDGQGDDRLSAASRAQLRLIRRSHARMSKVPARLAQEIARLTSSAQGIWAEARAANDGTAFLPVLAEVLQRKREEAACLSDGATSGYDALLDDYEPGATSAGLAQMFDRMRPRLVALRGAILSSGKGGPALQGRFDQDGQLTLARSVASAFGYDWSRGRLDLAVHPFSSGSGSDSRITTRVDEADPFNCLYSTIHEVGHSSYELSIDAAYRLTPVGHGASMGVHESQSRIYENQIGRSRAFTGWLFDRMQAQFGAAGVADADAFYRAVNLVRSGYIRTEADEVQYNLHVMLRFDLERALVAGDLAVGELEAAWNDRFLSDFGFAVDRPANGYLQDVHWSCGLFGYFPTYALGNVYAGCLYAALRRDTPGLDAALAQGDTSGATRWLRENLQQHGGLYEPRDLISRATGNEPGEAPFLDYLERKFTALYAL